MTELRLSCARKTLRILKVNVRSCVKILSLAEQGVADCGVAKESYSVMVTRCCFVQVLIVG